MIKFIKNKLAKLLFGENIVMVPAGRGAIVKIPKYCRAKIFKNGDFYIIEALSSEIDKIELLGFLNK